MEQVSVYLLRQKWKLNDFKDIFQNVSELQVELQETIQKKMLGWLMILGVPLNKRCINNPILIPVLGPKSSIALSFPSLSSA